MNRGPNNILFGIGSAGGGINQTTKQAHFRRATEVRFVVHGHGGFRTQLDHNQPLLPGRLALRANLMLEDKDTWREVEQRRARQAAFALTAKPFARTTVKAEYEFGRVEDIKDRPWAANDRLSEWLLAGRPLVAGVNVAAIPDATRKFGANTWRYIGNARQLWNFANQQFSDSPLAAELEGGGQSGGTFGWRRQGNAWVFIGEEIIPNRAVIRGPGNYTDYDFDVGSVVIEQRLGRDLFAEVAVHQERVYRQFASNGRNRYLNELFADPNLNLPNGQPNPYAGML
jgi:hypothetical protein